MLSLPPSPQAGQKKCRSSSTNPPGKQINRLGPVCWATFGVDYRARTGKFTTWVGTNFLLILGGYSCILFKLHLDPVFRLKLGPILSLKNHKPCQTHRNNNNKTCRPFLVASCAQPLSPSPRESFVFHYTESVCSCCPLLNLLLLDPGEEEAPVAHMLQHILLRRISRTESGSKVLHSRQTAAKCGYLLYHEYRRYIWLPNVSCVCCTTVYQKIFV